MRATYFRRFRLGLPEFRSSRSLGLRVVIIEDGGLAARAGAGGSVSRQLAWSQVSGLRQGFPWRQL
jgi:hypothetical protein